MELRQKQQQLQQERYQSSLNRASEPAVENYSNISLNDIRQRFPNSNNVYINEIHRLIQNENTLTLEQASNLAQGNGCGINGYNDMCPSRPTPPPQVNNRPPPPQENNRPPPPQENMVENFKQKGNCVGDDCDVTFSSSKNVDNKERYNKPQTISEKLKSLDITFYTNSGCGFCKQTMNLLEQSNATDGVKMSNKLPSGARGFPHFVSGTSGKSHTGFPGTLDRLYNLLS